MVALTRAEYGTNKKCFFLSDTSLNTLNFCVFVQFSLRVISQAFSIGPDFIFFSGSAPNIFWNIKEALSVAELAGASGSQQRSTETPVSMHVCHLSFDCACICGTSCKIVYSIWGCEFIVNGRLQGWQCFYTFPIKIPRFRKICKLFFDTFPLLWCEWIKKTLFFCFWPFSSQKHMFFISKNPIFCQLWLIDCPPPAHLSS